MAYFSQEKKKKVAPLIKALLKEYGLKGTLAIRHHSTVVLNVQSGSLDFIKNSNEIIIKENERAQKLGQHLGVLSKDYIDVNVFHVGLSFSGACKEFLEKAIKILNTDNFNESDPYTDYHHVGHYVDVNIGKWNKPYILTA